MRQLSKLDQQTTDLMIAYIQSVKFAYTCLGIKLRQKKNALIQPRAMIIGFSVTSITNSCYYITLVVGKMLVTESKALGRLGQT
jgi:hypothetical protein